MNWDDTTYQSGWPPWLCQLHPSHSLSRRASLGQAPPHPQGGAGPPDGECGSAAAPQPPSGRYRRLQSERGARSPSARRPPDVGGSSLAEQVDC